MKKNMGVTDRVVRILIAVVVLVLFITHVISGSLGIILLIMGGVLVFTGILGICPLYHLFGLRTDK